MVLFFYFRDFTTLISPQVKRRGACENQDEGVKEMASRCFCKNCVTKILREKNLSPKFIASQ